MTKQILFSFILALAFASTTLASDITGKYFLEGTNPGGGGAYQGEALVIQKDDVYVVAWRIANQQFMGTGLRMDESFAVVYEGEGVPAGLVLYKILPDGGMTGIYTNLGHTAVGTEVWKPISQ